MKKKSWNHDNNYKTTKIASIRLRELNFTFFFVLFFGSENLTIDTMGMKYVCVYYISGARLGDNKSNNI